MAIPRPVLLAIVGVLLVGAAFTATRGARGGGDSASDPAPAAQDAAKPPAAPARPEASKPEAEASARPSRAAGSAASGGGAAAPKSARALGMPRAVTRALAKRNTVVLFFHQGGADDTATARAVRSLPRRRTAVFTDSIRDVGDYRLLTEGVGVSRAPAVVIVGRDKRPRLVEGYVDAATLAQMVVDARR